MYYLILNIKNFMTDYFILLIYHYIIFIMCFIDLLFKGNQFEYNLFNYVINF